MNSHEDYLSKVEDLQKRDKMSEILFWIKEKFPALEAVIKWNEPMFILSGTFIIGFSMSKKHFSISPELKGIEQFKEKIEQAGYDHTKNIIRVKWDQEINYHLLREIIEFNIVDKEGFQKFWR